MTTPLFATPYAPLVNVRSFGATGDGVTDDGPAILAAIAAATAADARVSFPAGIYAFSSGLSGGGAGTIIQGEGRDRTVLRYTGSSGSALTLPAGLRGYTVSDLSIECPNGTASAIALSANFGHVRLLNIRLDPNGKGVDATAGNGIDIYMESVRCEGGTIAFDFDASAVTAINNITCINCYASSPAITGFRTANLTGLLMGCAVDASVSNSAYSLGGNITAIACTAENNVIEGFAVLGNQTFSLIDCITTNQLKPFRIAASGAVVRMIGCRSTGTPSGQSLDISAATSVFLDDASKLDAGLSSAATAYLQGRLGNAYFSGTFAGPQVTPTETVLVSGVDAGVATSVVVTLSAARVVGQPLNPLKGQRLSFTFIQGGAGAWGITWNAVFKVTWSNTGNATGKRSTVAFVYDGTSWNQESAQAPYV